MPYHGTVNVGVRGQVAPDLVALTVNAGANPGKLYVNGVNVSFTGATPNAYFQVVSQKSGGASEGNPDDCASFTGPLNYPAVLDPTLKTSNTGAYNASAFTFGDAGPVTDAAAIGCWQVQVQVNAKPAAATWVPAGGLKINAGTMKVEGKIENGSGPVLMAPGPNVTWTYGPQPATEPCGAGPCTVANYTAPDPPGLRGSGGAAGHRMEFVGGSASTPYYPPYPYADVVSWTNKCATNVATAKHKASQSIPTAGCAGADRGTFEFTPDFYNTRIKVLATVNGVPYGGDPVAGGSPSGSAGTASFPPPASYSISGPQTLSGSDRRLFWGMPNR